MPCQGKGRKNERKKKRKKIPFSPLLLYNNYSRLYYNYSRLNSPVSMIKFNFTLFNGEATFTAFIQINKNLIKKKN